MQTTTRWIVTRGFGDVLVRVSLTRGAFWGHADAMTFPSRKKAEWVIKYYDIAGARAEVAM